MEFVPTLIIFGILFLALAVGWVWLLLGVRKEGWRGVSGFVGLNLSAVSFLLGFTLGGPIYAIVAAFLPVLALPLVVMEIMEYLPFLRPVLIWAAIIGAVAMLVFAAFPPLRKWSLTLAVVVAFIAALPLAEGASRRHMCIAAAELGVTGFERSTFYWSIRNTPRPFQTSIHAKIQHNGQVWGWSYRELNFYPIPETIIVDVRGGLMDCAARTA